MVSGPILAYMGTVETNQNNAEMIAQASALQKEGRLPEALVVLNKILKMNPSDVEALKRLALVQLQTGEVTKAYKAAQAAQKVRPKSKSVLQVLAVASLGVGEWSVAIQCFEVLTKHTPDFALYYKEWSRAEYELTNISRAIDRYQDYLRLIPKATRPPTGESSYLDDSSAGDCAVNVGLEIPG